MQAGEQFVGIVAVRRPQAVQAIRRRGAADFPSARRLAAFATPRAGHVLRSCTEEAAPYVEEVLPLVLKADHAIGYHCRGQRGGVRILLAACELWEAG